MKYAKYLVLAGGVIGLLGMFMASITGTQDFRDPATGARADVEVGIGPLSGVSISVDDDTAARLEAEGVDLDALVSTANDLLTAQMQELKGILMVPFVAPLLLVIFFLIGRKRFGRGLGIGSILIALLALGVVAMVDAAAASGSKPGVHLSTGMGLTMIRVCGVMGLLGGLLATIKPERKVPTVTVPETLPDA